HAEDQVGEREGQAGQDQPDHVAEHPEHARLLTARTARPGGIDGSPGAARLRSATVQLGVTFPQIEIGSDVGVVREYAQAAQDLGYDYLLAYDHVLGAGRGTRPDWSGPYDSSNPFHEPFT